MLEAIAACETFNSVRSTFLTPKIVVITSGQNDENQISMIAGLSPMPKKRIASGMSAMPLASSGISGSSSRAFPRFRPEAADQQAERHRGDEGQPEADEHAGEAGRRVMKKCRPGFGEHFPYFDRPRQQHVGIRAAVGRDLPNDQEQDQWRQPEGDLAETTHRLKTKLVFTNLSQSGLALICPICCMTSPTASMLFRKSPPTS